jgi:hypothetical protein
VQFPGNPAGLVSKALDCRFTTAPEHFIQTLLDVALRQSTRDATAGAGPPHVLQKCPRWGGEAQAAYERPVGCQSWRSLAWAQDHSWQNDVAFVIGDDADEVDTRFDQYTLLQLHQETPSRPAPGGTPAQCGR